MNKKLALALLSLQLGCTSSPSRAAPPPASKATDATRAPAPAAAVATSSAAGGELLLGGGPGGPRPPRRARNTTSPLGTNLTMMKPWSGEWPFKDAFHQAMPWRSENQPGIPDPRPLALDDNGWIKKLEPGQRGIARFFISEEPVHFPPGVYTVTWEGRGTIELENVPNVVGRQHNGMMMMMEPKARAFGIAITATDPRDYIRNIQVIMPGGSCENDDNVWCMDNDACGGATCLPFAATVKRQPYHPTFLKSLEIYSALRFMFWNDTIGTTVSKWSERTLPTAGIYAGNGVPYEVMIQLSNHTRTDMWLTIPLRADDDFVEKLATLVKTELDPELKVYLEYSNEVWNGAFPMAHEMREKGLAAKLDENPFRAQMYMYARRSVEVFRIWSKVFGGDPRLVRVLGGQSDGWASARFALEFEKTYEHVDALAIAPYFGASAGTPAVFPRWPVATTTPDKVLDAVETFMLPEAITGMKAHQDMVAEFGKKRGKPIELIAYEGGQHLVGVDWVQQDARIKNLFHAANRSPRMRGIYTQYLDAWRAHGGHLFVHFVHTNINSMYGSWGLLERPTQTRAESPKLDAVMTFIEKNPRWW